VCELEAIVVIYLDYNVILDVTEARTVEVHQKILDLQSGGGILPFGTAHVEEASGRFRSPHIISSANPLISPLLSYLETMSKGYAIVPHGTNGKTEVVTDYNVNDCFCNVVGENGYGLYLTQKAEETHRRKTMDVCQNRDSKVTSKVTSMPWEKVMASQIFIDACDLYQVPHEYSPNSRGEEEQAWQAVFWAFEKIGYSPEPLRRSPMHDLTHAISASVADVFVTNDKKLFRKMEAAIHFWGLKIKLLKTDGFVKTNF